MKLPFIRVPSHEHPDVKELLLIFNNLLRQAKTANVRIIGYAPVTGGLQQVANIAESVSMS